MMYTIKTQSSWCPISGFVKLWLADFQLYLTTLNIYHSINKVVTAFPVSQTGVSIIRKCNERETRESCYRHWTGLQSFRQKQNTLLKKRLLQNRLKTLKENLKQSAAELGLSYSFFSQYDNNPKSIDEDFPTEDQSESYWLTCTKYWLQLHWKSVAWSEDKAPSQKAIKPEIAELFVKGDWAVRSLLKATANTCRIKGYKND